MFEKAPYLFLAKSVGEEAQFYEAFFKVWFERWPLQVDSDTTPGTDLKKDTASSTSMLEELTNMVKKVRRSTVAVSWCRSNTIILLPF
jgi:hypothetical protein